MSTKRELWMICATLLLATIADARPLITQAGEKLGELSLPAGIVIVTMEELRDRATPIGETADFLAYLEDRRDPNGGPIIWRLSRIEDEYIPAPGSLSGTKILGELRGAVARQQEKDPQFPVEKLTGFSLGPVYDDKFQAMQWALNIRFRKNNTSTVNYAIRKFLRRGFLMMDVAGLPTQLPKMRAGAEAILKGITIAPGQRHQDFDPKIDLLSDREAIDILQSAWPPVELENSVNKQKTLVASLTASVGLLLFGVPALFRRSRKRGQRKI